MEEAGVPYIYFDGIKPSNNAHVVFVGFRLELHPTASTPIDVYLEIPVDSSEGLDRALAIASEKLQAQLLRVVQKLKAGEPYS